MEAIVRDPARTIQLLIMESLERDDPVLNQLAAEALAAVGRDVVHTLMIEVFTSDNVRYRLDLLQVVEAIGEMPDPGDHLELFRLARDRDARIRAAAGASNARRGSPWSATADRGTGGGCIEVTAVSGSRVEATGVYEARRRPTGTRMPPVQTGRQQASQTL